jgi:hypothetical protein
MIRKFVSLIIAVGVLLAGCRTPANERVLQRYDPARRPQVRKAPYAGQYRLYATADRHPTMAGATPLRDLRLAKGELIGFARDSADQLVAVVRGEHTPLDRSDSAASDEAAYVWTMQPDAGQIDATRTALLVGGIVVVGIVIGVAAAAASSVSSSTTVALPL